MRNLIPLVAAFAATAVPTCGIAQSVLERVLGQIETATNLAPVNGVYANIAESVFSTGLQTVNVDTTLANADTSTRIFQIYGRWFTVGDLGTTIPASTTGFWDDVAVATDGTVTIVNATDMITGDSYVVRDVAGNIIQTISDTAGAASTIFGGEIVFTDSVISYLASSTVGVNAGWDKVLREQTFTVPVSTVIDGSVTNIINGVTEATAQALARSISATEFTLPNIDIGDVATTALGAVNTGDITVGVNFAVDETSAATTRAISASLTVVGGSADTGTMMLNIAHNSSVIQGNVENTLIAVNGSIGNLSTTALGAVNTGTIVSGVDAAVQGIVGMSGQTSF